MRIKRRTKGQRNWLETCRRRNTIQCVYDLQGNTHTVNYANFPYVKWKTGKKKWRVNASFYLKFNFNGINLPGCCHTFYSIVWTESQNFKRTTFLCAYSSFQTPNEKLFVYTNGKLAANVNVLRSFWIIIIIMMITNPSKTACTLYTWIWNLYA